MWENGFAGRTSAQRWRGWVGVTCQRWRGCVSVKRFLFVHYLFKQLQKQHIGFRKLLGVIRDMNAGHGVDLFNDAESHLLRSAALMIVATSDVEGLLKGFRVLQQLLDEIA